MEYEQLSYWKEFSKTTPWIFENLWYWAERNLDVTRVEVEGCQTGHWFMSEKDQPEKHDVGVVIYCKDSGYGVDTSFISRLSPAGFISKRQLLVAKDQLKGSSSCRMINIRKNWRFFEFEPWTSLTEDTEHIDSLEFDISELALSLNALDSVTVQNLSIEEASSTYKRWFKK